METILKNPKLVTIGEYLGIWISLLPYALCVNQLMVPQKIVGGGLTGLTEIIYFASSTTIPIWCSSLVLNGILILIAGFLIGWKFCVRTIIGVLSLAFWFKVIPVAAEPFLSDTFMSVVVSGMICGVALAMVYLCNGSSGGTDIIAMIINKYKHVSIGKALFMCDLLIISSAYFLPDIQACEHPIEKIIYGLVFTLVYTEAVDMAMRRAKHAVQFTIFSKRHAEQIATAINERAHRGVTITPGIGWYSKREIRVLTVLVKSNQQNHIFEIIKEIDPNAFVSMADTQGVFGKGFETVLNKKEQEMARQLEIEQDNQEKAEKAQQML
ncbi:MAG: YitT family protein [Paludibacteraceae bacterium]|nr:YitT family protein [Paludibacteraceae bacterium]